MTKLDGHDRRRSPPTALDLHALRQTLEEVEFDLNNDDLNFTTPKRNLELVFLASASTPTASASFVSASASRFKNKLTPQSVKPHTRYFSTNIRPNKVSVEKLDVGNHPTMPLGKQLILDITYNKNDVATVLETLPHLPPRFPPHQTAEGRVEEHQTKEGTTTTEDSKDDQKNQNHHHHQKQKEKQQMEEERSSPTLQERQEQINTANDIPVFEAQSATHQEKRNTKTNVDNKSAQTPQCKQQCKQMSIIHAFTPAPRLSAILGVQNGTITPLLEKLKQENKNKETQPEITVPSRPRPTGPVCVLKTSSQNTQNKKEQQNSKEGTMTNLTTTHQKERINNHADLSVFLDGAVEAREYVKKNKWNNIKEQNILDGFLESIAGEDWNVGKLYWDNKTCKKKFCGQSKNKGVRDLSQNTRYIECKNFTVVDIDKDGPLSRRILEATGSSCNLIAFSPRGVHLYFRGATTALAGFQGHGVDIRTWCVSKIEAYDKLPQYLCRLGSRTC
eukprot:PhM_4_TR16818/c0_g1_i9/m.104784